MIILEHIKPIYITYDVQHIYLFMYEPKESHFIALQRIFRYIQGTTFHDLQLYASPIQRLITYDANRESSRISRHSTSDYYVFIF